jgi:protein-S-isoprenylcysteine O-methyltransferase Ste14
MARKRGDSTCAANLDICSILAGDAQGWTYTGGVRTLLYATVGIWVLCEIFLIARDYRAGRIGTPASDRSSGTVIGFSIVFAIAFGVGSTQWFPWAHIDVPLLTGIVCMWIGVALRLWAVRTLGTFFRLVVMVQAGHRVITAGPYRWVRHPSYTGGLLALLGLGLAQQNWMSIILMMPLALFGITYRILVEEEALEASLGDEYRVFEHTRARLIPKVW